MATREQNLLKAAFYAVILEQTISEIEGGYKKGLSPLVIANLRRRFNDMNYSLQKANSHRAHKKPMATLIPKKTPLVDGAGET